MEVEREFVVSIGEAAGEEEQRKKILCQGCEAGPERIVQRLQHRRRAYQWSTLRLW